MLLPAALKGQSQKKYYDFVAAHELSEMAEIGITKNLIKVKVFSTSMDTKGREELTGMQTCQSYHGCPVCTHRFTAGAVLSQKKVVCDGYRRFLRADSRARQRRFRFHGHTYEYRSGTLMHGYVCRVYLDSPFPHHRDVEERGAPKIRDDNFVRTAVSLATEKKPVVGHKMAPLLACWPEFNWIRYNVPEIMHGEGITLQIRLT